MSVLQIVKLSTVELTYDLAELAGDFAVWLTSSDASFLHGRLVQSAWDIEELLSETVKDQIEKDPFLLKVRVLGFHP